MIFYFMLACAFVNLIDTSLSTFKNNVKDLCGRLIILLDYVKDLIYDTLFPNLLNPNPVISNLITNSLFVKPHPVHRLH